MCIRKMHYLNYTVLSNVVLEMYKKYFNIKKYTLVNNNQSIV